jgi:hypothetical protein
MVSKPSAEEVWASAIERTDQLCARDHKLAAIRKALVELERKAHATGWDGPDSRPSLFQLSVRDTQPVTLGCVVASPLPVLNETVRTVMECTNGHLPTAMDFIARGAIEISDIAQGKPIDMGMPNDVRHHVEAIRERHGRGRALADVPRGFDFYGYGLRSEAWMIDGHRDNETDLAMARNRQLHRHPRRREMRVVAFVGSDGLCWQVQRIRGEHPFSCMFRAEDDLHHRGAIYHNLSIMVNACGTTTIPIIPEGEL